MLTLDPSCWHSAFDGQLFAEIIPTPHRSWFIAILGHGLLTTTDRCYLTSEIRVILGREGFVIDQATWRSIPSPPSSQNPFLLKASLNRIFAVAQIGNAPLTVTYQDYPLQVVTPRRNKAPSRRSVLCFVTTNDGKFLQFGRSTNPDRFLAKLQKNYPYPLRLLGVIDIFEDEAKQLAQKFAYLRSQGQWFHFTPDLVSYVERLLKESSM